MADAQTNRDSLLWQEDFCNGGGAPIVGRVCAGLARVLDDGSATGRRFLGWAGDPKADAIPLRLAAPFHFLVRAGASSDLARIYAGETTDPAAIDAVLRATIAAHDAMIAGWLDGPPQTNETGRAGVLMAGLLVLAARFGARFELLEIGSSAGLNLMIDRYHFDLGEVEVGPSDSSVRIRPEWRGAPPPAVDVRIESVRGVDVAPIDVTDEAAAARLMAYVWIDAADRIARSEQAIAMARADPPSLVRGDAADWVEARLAEPQAAGVTRVLMHSVVWQYIAPEGQRRIEAAMAAAGARASAERPLAWVTMEADRTLNQHTLLVKSWPGEGAPVRHAVTHAHGRWIEWEGVSP